MSKKLTNKELREQLWETLKAVKSKSIDAESAKAVAELGRTILKSGELDLKATEHFNESTDALDIFSKLPRGLNESNK